jgi:hypothetical protein
MHPYHLSSTLPKRKSLISIGKDCETQNTEQTLNGKRGQARINWFDGRNSQTAYLNIPYKQAGYKMQDQIVRDLAGKGGGDCGCK